MTSIVNALLLASAVASRDGMGRDCVAETDRVARFAVEAARDISAMDAQGFLRHLPAEGVACGDSFYDRAEVERQLRTPGEWLNALIGNAAELARACPGEFPDRPLSDSLRASEWQSLFIELDQGLWSAHVSYLGEARSLRATVDFENIGRHWFVQGGFLCGPTCFPRDRYRQTEAERMDEVVRVALKATGAQGEFSAIRPFKSRRELLETCPDVARAVGPFEGEAWLGVVGDVSGKRGSSWIVLDERGEPKARGAAAAPKGKR